LLCQCPYTIKQIDIDRGWEESPVFINSTCLGQLTRDSVRLPFLTVPYVYFNAIANAIANPIPCPMLNLPFLKLYPYPTGYYGAACAFGQGKGRGEKGEGEWKDIYIYIYMGKQNYRPEVVFRKGLSTLCDKLDT
jgi:hypothetical protein